jgi:DNA-binding IclR family transcriptional regulator
MQNRPRSGLNSGLDVLECLAAAQRSLSLTEIAAAIGMSKSSVHALLATLERRGFITRLSDQSYRIGLKAWGVGCLAAPVGMARIAAPHMALLARELSEGVSLGVLDGVEMVCIQLIESLRAVRVHSNVGDRTPAHCVSAGLAILSCLAPGGVEKLFPDRLWQATDETIGDRAALLKELSRVRARGYAVSRGAWRPEVAGISVPVRGPDDHVVAGLCVAAPRFRVTDRWVKHTAPALLATAENIGREFGAVDANRDAASVSPAARITA